jgi:hypothetical protein
MRIACWGSQNKTLNVYCDLLQFKFTDHCLSSDEMKVRIIELQFLFDELRWRSFSE